MELSVCRVMCGLWSYVCGVLCVELYVCGVCV